MSASNSDILRGKELQNISLDSFLELWETKLRHYTPQELQTIEPFFTIVAMQKLYLSTGRKPPTKKEVGK